MIVTAGALTRSWPPLAAWGAGLLQVALGAGAITGGDAAARAAGIPLVVVGLAALAWGAVRLAGRDAARAGVSVAVAGVIATAVVLAIDPARTSVVAVAAAVALDAFVGAAAGRRVGGGRRGRGVPARPSPARTGVVGILMGAVVVAGIVTPALGATEAGRLAPDHSTHGVLEPANPHGH